MAPYWVVGLRLPLLNPELGYPAPEESVGARKASLAHEWCENSPDESG